MAKGNKDKNIETEEVKVVAEVDKIQELEDKIKNLQKTLELLGNFNFNALQKEADVEVVSLTRGKLNLFTEGNGSGVRYEFMEFGESQEIPYSDLKLIIKNNKSFFINGLVYVKSAELIKASGLEQAYKKIITKEQLEELFTMNKKSFEKIFKGLTEEQKKLFSELIITKIVKAENVDFNIVKCVGDLMEVDLMAEAESNRQVLKDFEK